MSNSKEGTSCPDGYRALSTAELRELLQSDDKMDQIIRLNEKFQELQVDREILLTSNRSLAEESLAQRPCLNNGKLQLAEKYKELSNLITTCWEKQSQLGRHPNMTPQFETTKAKLYLNPIQLSVTAALVLRLKETSHQSTEKVLSVTETSLHLLSKSLSMTGVRSWEPNGAYQMPAGSLQQFSRNLQAKLGRVGSFFSKFCF
ncbi:hypothetical protein ATANTOWER_014538 [Ataeniobius toweri]|uniref:VPS37 C-terminal domain-containing protein n=1 Tax=Ataeniobius toweri TaxID=208326 RepID=A0ABU7AF58_9TELE|nr:hypothetical protein [Ataeniobius toweri]